MFMPMVTGTHPETLLGKEKLPWAMVTGDGHADVANVDGAGAGEPRGEVLEGDPQLRPHVTGDGLRHGQRGGAPGLVFRGVCLTVTPRYSLRQ